MKRILRIRWPQTISHQQIQENTGVNRTSDEIRRRKWNWIGHIMRKGREEHCVTALESTPEGRRRPGRPKTTWRRMVEDERQTAGWRSHGRMSEPLQQIVVGGKRMSKPYVPYGMERYRYRFGIPTFFFWELVKDHSPHVRESKRVLDSGFRIVDSGFQ
ncbi:hypothetical protein ACROYT_G038696 [Oculina patagonica]